MNWICLALLFSTCSVNCKQKGSKVIATFSEDDISDKLPSPESVAAQIPKKLILKEPSKKLKISNSTQNKKPMPKDKEVKKLRHSKRKSSNENSDVSFERKSKSMNAYDDNSSDGSEGERYEIPDVSDNFIVVEPTVDQVATPSNTQSSGIETPTASIVQIARIYATTKEKEQDFPSIPPKKEKIRRSGSNGRMHLKRANSSTGVHVNYVLSFIALAAIFALI